MVSGGRSESGYEKAITPKFPAGCRCRGVVRVYVLVDTQGKVACARTLSGHPLLQAASLQAAQQWEFEPLTENGKEIPFIGTLPFDFSVD